MMKGKRVDVYFSMADALFDVLVEHEPQNVGDSWHLRSADGLEHRVIIFEVMSERAAKLVDAHCSQPATQPACQPETTPASTHG
jgi:hypothetical protein